MLSLVALLLLLFLLGGVLVAFLHLAGRVRRLEEANAVLLDLVSTQMTLGPADHARLAVAVGADRLPRPEGGPSRAAGESREG